MLQVLAATDQRSDSKQITREAWPTATYLTLHPGPRIVTGSKYSASDEAPTGSA